MKTRKRERIRSRKSKSLVALVVLPVTTSLLGVAISLFGFCHPTAGFTIPAAFPSGEVRIGRRSSASIVSHVPRTSDSFVTDAPSNSGDDDDDDNDDNQGMSDVQLLKQTPKAQLVSLCQQFSLSTKGKKEELLQRLRDYAKEQAEKERKRLLERRRKVEEGGSDDRERFEIVDGGDFIDDDDEDDDDVYFYYPSVDTKKDEKSEGVSSRKSPNRPKQPLDSRTIITTPPPPPIEPDENGERVVTVYSTTDQNDLTGVAAAQPGQAAAQDVLTSNFGVPSDAPWDTNNKKSTASDSEIDAAREEVGELVHSLLSMSGAPGFQHDFDDSSSSLLGSGGIFRQRSSFSSSPEGFVGFDPTKVPTDMLTKASKSLRTNRGRLLQEVLREYELKAVGYDGPAGDNKQRGGGHYRQVSKVRSFLEGYRRAEVRRLARETATVLLDKLVSEGIEGLDITLASMTRSSDDTSDEAGELNDSLLDYLNDAIRQQEKKVEQMLDSVKKIAELESFVTKDDGDAEDPIEKLWTVDSEDGQRIETFDPQNPTNQKLLREEYDKSLEVGRPQIIIPKSAPEKLLLLLKLLRERVKTEAAFSHDEKARNLRVLAYCLNLHSDDLKKQLMLKELGSSLDRLDSFAELVASSIEYGESTSHQLQPSRQGSLDVGILKRILHLTKELREKRSWEASGVKASRNKLSP